MLLGEKPGGRVPQRSAREVSREVDLARPGSVVNN